MSSSMAGGRPPPSRTPACTASACPHHSDSLCPRISASSARRSVYSTSGVSETEIDATDMFNDLDKLAPRPSLRAERSNPDLQTNCFVASLLAMTSLHMPDFVRHVVKGRVPVDF